MIVTYQDAKELLYCNRGMRDFFARHGLDYQDFKLNGIEDERLLALDDAMANDLVQYVRSKQAGVTT